MLVPRTFSEALYPLLPLFLSVALRSVVGAVRQVAELMHVSYIYGMQFGGSEHFFFLFNTHDEIFVMLLVWTFLEHT